MNVLSNISSDSGARTQIVKECVILIASLNSAGRVKELV
jgi:hypothetical protein